MEEKPSLMHYASKYYDPQKAHEYYEQHKQLVGRRSTSQLNDTGKEIWSYTKNSITNEKKSAIESQRKSYQSDTEKLREKAKQAREAITKKLSELVKAISEEDKAQKKSISESAKLSKEQIVSSKETRIKQLMNTPIPKNLSKAQKQKLIAERDKQIAAIRSETAEQTERIASSAKDQRTKVSEVSKATKESERGKSKVEREKVAADLKSALASARQKFEESKKAINGNYEDVYQKEYDSIKSSYRKVTKSKTRR